jgi:DeoR/GlpR family transcriptional regulator of sugar metabolism
MARKQREAQTVIDRRSAIVQQVQRCHHLSVTELSQRFGVSEPTIRRDLRCLEEIGLLRRVHGGAEADLQAGPILPFELRLLQNAQVKQAIGKAASTLIHPGDTILLDSGTTVLEIARHLPRSLLEGGQLTVVTRSLAIASELRRQKQIRLVLLGGLYVHDFDTLVGLQVERALQEMHVDILFTGVDGIAVDSGLTTDNLSEVGLHRIMAQCANQVVAVTDSSKVGANNLQTILSLDEIHSLITDSGAPEAFLKAVRNRGVQVIVVSPPI